VFVFVSFRSHHPEEATMKEALKKLQDNNMEFIQLVEVKSDHCQ
jgi:hypothetical protein